MGRQTNARDRQQAKQIADQVAGMPKGKKKDFLDRLADDNRRLHDLVVQELRGRESPWRSEE